MSLTDFQNFPEPVAFFQDFPVLENATVKLQDFPGFPGPVGTLLKGQLLRQIGLSLQKALEMSKSKDVTKQQLKSLKNKEKKNSAEEMHKFKPKGPSQHKKLKKSFNQNTLKPRDSKVETDQTLKRTDGKGKTTLKGKCKYCGNQMHPKRRDCPAFGQVCRKCNKSNHFASVCNAKWSNSGNVVLSEDNSDSDLSVL